jgi:hypothetical protein
MGDFDVDGAVRLANARLRSAGVDVTIEVRGRKLRLRATLPPKPNDTISAAKQHSISLGVSATREGLKEIEAKAHELHRQRDRDTFTWADWDRKIAKAEREIVPPINYLSTS